MRPWKFPARGASLLLLGLASFCSTAQSAGAGLGGPVDGLGNTMTALGRRHIVPTEGTEPFAGTMSYQGLARTWSGIRPAGGPEGAPMLILLHPSHTTPEEVANIARVGRLAQLYGAWVYLPDSQRGKWNDDPAHASTRDDSGFLAALIKTAITEDRIDPRHIYVAGYSNGGFMAERFACEHSGLIAGIAMVAATLHDSLRTDCSFAHPMPVLMFDGTADPIIPYTGLPTLPGAKSAMRFFAQQSGCGIDAITTTDLPHLAVSGLTSVILTSYTACPATGLAELYTIRGGGHTWPGAPGIAGLGLGATTQDIDATLQLWQTLITFASP